MSKVHPERGNTHCGAIVKLPTILLLLMSTALLNAQSGWKIATDETGACQISVPPNWSLLSAPGRVNSPMHTGTWVVLGATRFTPFSPLTIKMLGAGKLFENSSQRIFYVTKPTGNPPFVNYHVEAPGKSESCIVQITLPPNALEEDAKKIALSLSPTH